MTLDRLLRVVVVLRVMRDNLCAEGPPEDAEELVRVLVKIQELSEELCTLLDT